MKPLALAWLLVLLPSIAHAQALPRVVVLATGGTIASTYDSSKGGFVAALFGADLVAFLDLTVASDKPVIVVGAQRAAAVRDSDGPPRCGPRST